MTENETNQTTGHDQPVVSRRDESNLPSLYRWFGFKMTGKPTVRVLAKNEHEASIVAVENMWHGSAFNTLAQFVQVTHPKMNCVRWKPSGWMLTKTILQRAGRLKACD